MCAIDPLRPESRVLHERISIAALRASDGDPARLTAALHVATADWRDLLVAADFAHDSSAHERWSPARDPRWGQRSLEAFDPDVVVFLVPSESVAVWGGLEQLIDHVGVAVRPSAYRVDVNSGAQSAAIQWIRSMGLDGVAVDAFATRGLAGEFDGVGEAWLAAMAIAFERHGFAWFGPRCNSPRAGFDDSREFVLGGHRGRLYRLTHQTFD